jgi:ribosomal protein L7/L12
LTEKLPSILKEAVPKKEADEWVKKLKDKGAKDELE